MPTAKRFPGRVLATIAATKYLYTYAPGLGIEKQRASTTALVWKRTIGGTPWKFY